MSHFPGVERRRLERLSVEQRARLAARLGLHQDDGGGRGGRGGGARLVAYVVPREPGACPDPAELRAFLGERLPEYMLPSAFVVLDRLPRTPNGKLDMAALPEPPAAAIGAAGVFVAPRTVVEETLARIWAELLGGARVGVHDNFFEIGGDSILSIQVVARANGAGLRLTPDQLFQHQTIAELARVAGAASSPIADQGVVTGPAPLTPIQHWFFEQPLLQPNHWHHHLWLTATTPIDAELLAEALRRVVLHHDALRLRFSREPSGWRQELADAEEVSVPVRTLDVGGLPVGEQDSAMLAAADAFSSETDLQRGPLARALLVECGRSRPQRLLLSIHHLVVDAVSWQPLLEDLCEAYARLAGGQEVVLPAKTASFRAWAEALAEYAASDRLREEVGYWLTDSSVAAPIPTDVYGAFTEESARTHQVSLTADEAEVLLKRLPAAYQAQAEELLLTAVAAVLSRWTGASRLRLGLERHGREPVVEGIDVTRTVGWFTSYFPVTLDLERSASPVGALASVKAQLRRVPNRGIGYGVLRYLGREASVRQRLAELREPEVIFNYAGGAAMSTRSGAVLRAEGVPTASRGRLNRRSHALEIDVFHAGGRLHLGFTYCASLHHPATIEGLAERCAEALRELIRHATPLDEPRYTPADFPEAGLDQQELDRLLEGLSP